MIDIAKGRYWDQPWSLVESCTRCSPGCDHCWALAIEKRFKKGYEGQVFEHPERLSIPMKRGKATVYSIWNDWAHESVDHDFRQQMVEVSAQCPQHTILALTKRPGMVLDFYCEWMIDRINAGFCFPDNWWTGLTVCNQVEADEKIPVFLQVPGKKFLSIEPMLGAIKVKLFGECGSASGCCDDNSCRQKIDAVIVGGETGPGARPMQIDWVRSIRNQCRSANVPFFFKSFGKYPPFGNYRLLDGEFHDDLPWRPL
jgi:protein gp37